MSNQYLEFKERQERRLKEYIVYGPDFSEGELKEAIHDNGGFAYEYFKLEMEQNGFFDIAFRLYDGSEDAVKNLLLVFKCLNRMASLDIDFIDPDPVILRAFDLALADHMNKAGSYFDDIFMPVPVKK